MQSDFDKYLGSTRQPADILYRNDIRRCVFKLRYFLLFKRAGSSLRSNIMMDWKFQNYQVAYSIQEKSLTIKLTCSVAVFLLVLTTRSATWLLAKCGWDWSAVKCKSLATRQHTIKWWREIKLMHVSYSERKAPCNGGCFRTTLAWLITEQTCHVLFAAEHFGVIAQAFLAPPGHTTSVS